MKFDVWCHYLGSGDDLGEGVEPFSYIIESTDTFEEAQIIVNKQFDGRYRAETYEIKENGS